MVAAPTTHHPLGNNTTLNWLADGNAKCPETVMLVYWLVIVFSRVTLNFQAVFPHAVDITVGKGTESLEFCHRHLKPDVGVG